MVECLRVHVAIIRHLTGGFQEFHSHSSEVLRGKVAAVEAVGVGAAVAVGAGADVGAGAAVAVGAGVDAGAGAAVAVVAEAEECVGGVHTVGVYTVAVEV